MNKKRQRSTHFKFNNKDKDQRDAPVKDVTQEFYWVKNGGNSLGNRD